MDGRLMNGKFWKRVTSNQKALNKREVYWEEAYEATSKHCGLNVKKAGHNGRHAKSTIEKIRKANTGHKMPDHVKRNLIRILKGKPLSAAHKKKLRAAKLNKPSGRKGMKLSKEWRNNLSIAHKGQLPANARRVMCIELNKTFISCAHAARYLCEHHGKKKASGCAIARLCNGGICYKNGKSYPMKTVYGFHWKFPNKQSKEHIENRCSSEWKQNISKGLTGRKLSPEHIINRSLAQSGKGHWASKPVLCVQTKIKYINATEAAKILRANGFPNAIQTAISRVCRGQWNMAYGYKWKFLHKRK